MNKCKLSAFVFRCTQIRRADKQCDSLCGQRSYFGLRGRQPSYIQGTVTPTCLSSYSSNNLQVKSKCGDAADYVK
jgi:hypothetical protein